MYINFSPGLDMVAFSVSGFVLWVSVWVLFLKDDFGIVIDVDFNFSAEPSSVDL